MGRGHARSTRPDDARDGERRRRSIAVEAARLISEQGIRDYAAAKRKAAERLGFALDAALPKNSEVEDALREHQRLFGADEQPQVLRELREAAREALQFFAPFDPRLVGPVLDGSADRYTAVCLHVFADEAETADEVSIEAARAEREAAEKGLASAINQPFEETEHLRDQLETANARLQIASK